MSGSYSVFREHSTKIHIGVGLVVVLLSGLLGGYIVSGLELNGPAGPVARSFGGGMVGIAIAVPTLVIIDAVEKSVLKRYYE